MSVMQDTVIVRIVMAKEIRDTLLLAAAASKPVCPMQLIPHWQSADAYELVVATPNRWAPFTVAELNSIIQAAQGDIWGTDINGLETEIRSELSRREALS